MNFPFLNYNFSIYAQLGQWVIAGAGFRGRPPFISRLFGCRNDTSFLLQQIERLFVADLRPEPLQS
jgi:hypothetical protein